MLWHKILGHIGEKGLQAIQGKYIVEGMSNCKLDFDFCDHYLYEKNNWVKFPSGATREKEVSKLIQNDVFGNVHVPSLGGSIYYVSFIYYFLRNTWLYFLKNIWGF